MGVLDNNPIANVPALTSSSSSRQAVHSSKKTSASSSSIDNSPRQPSTQSFETPNTEEVVQFRSALSYTEVRDYAYPEFHPLHYGVRPEPEEPEVEEASEYPDAYMQDGGPPWREDPDLVSPVLISHGKGDRGSREYEFSVASADEIHGRAVALFDFIPENDNEAPLKEGQIIWVSYRHGQGWLVAEDPETGETGLVPEEYVQLIESGHGYTSSSAGVDDHSTKLETMPEEKEPIEELAHEQQGEIDEEGWVDEGPISEAEDTISKQVDNPDLPFKGKGVKEHQENIKSNSTTQTKSDDLVSELAESLEVTKL